MPPLTSSAPSFDWFIPLNRRPWNILAGLVLLLAVFLFGGLALYQQQERTILREHHEHLHAISRLKIDQILAWRQERLADVRMHSSGMVRLHAQQWLQTPQPHLLEDIRQRLQFFQDNESYANMMLVDAGGRILVTLLPRVTALEPDERALVDQVINHREPVLGDFFHCRHCNEPHLEVAAPIFAGDRVALVLILVADPHRDLYPMLQAWPTADHNAESLLVRRDGEKVRFLSRLRHLGHPPLSFHLAMDRTDEPAVQAALGQTGMAVGSDYRGETVLADLNRIPETDWFMVTKMDTGALLTEARSRTGMVLLLLFMAVLTAGFLVQLTSLSRRKALSEALLREEREHHHTRGQNRAVLYSIGEGVIATDDATLITRMNPAAESMTGWPETESLGRPLAEIYRIIDEDSGQPVELPVHRVLRDGITVGLSNHILLIAKDGGHLAVADNAAPIRDEQGKITGVVLVVRDQSRHRAAEKARIESAKRYADLVESISDFIWETGPDHRYSFCNTRSFGLLGYRPEEIVGKCWLDILDREVESPESIERFKQVLANRQPYSQLCRTFVAKDGGRVVLESSGVPIFTPEGDFQGYRGISRDITERKKAEEEQKQLEAQLLQSQKMEVVGRLAGGVAHDFNNMLTIIGSYVEMSLNDLPEDHRLAKRLREVHHATLHSADLTRQLLAFARKQVVSPRVLDVNETITDALKMLHRLIGENIELVWKPGPDPGQVLFDPTQLGQILANLAVNARDAIAGIGRLTIATRAVDIDEPVVAGEMGIEPGRYVQLIVHDDGCGMDESTLGRIFEPFFTTKEEGRGTGLGLATVYGILKQNRGGISVHSTPGRGTTFTLYIPRAGENGATFSAIGSALENGGTETILLVEDEKALLELGVAILAQRGYSILTALTPAEAIDLAHSHPTPIDLLVTDVIMPEMNGLELAEAIRCIRPTIKVLFMSGYTADIIGRHGAIDSGICFLEKPFTARSLSKKIREVLHHG